MTTRYNVHIYREMRLRFDGIEADSPEQAAEKARDMHFGDAQCWSDCKGDTLAALVDVVGDEGYSKSIVIDFEPGRMLKAAPKLLEALQALVNATSCYARHFHEHQIAQAVILEVTGRAA